MYNLIQVQNRLKELPSSPQTMQYLTAASKGQYPEVPPYVALGEMQRRETMNKQMATAQGAAQGPTPTVADQMESKVKEQAAGLIALQQGRTQAAQQQQPPQGGPAPENIPQPEQQEEPPAMMAQGGIAHLPVDSRMFNYQQGGVIGYAGPTGSVVGTKPPDAAAEAAIQEAQRTGDRDAMLMTLKKLGAAGYDVTTLIPRAFMGVTEDIANTRLGRALGIDFKIPKEAYGGDRESMTPMLDRVRRQEEAKAGATPAQAPAPAQEAAPKPMASADMAMRQAPAPAPVANRGLPAALPKAKPSPVAQAPQVSPAPAPTEAEQFLRTQMRAQPATPMTDEQIIARNAGLRPEALKTPAGSEEMKRLDAMQKQYEASTADRGLEGLMAGLAGRTQGRGGMGAGYLKSQAANRAADMAQAELQNKMRANIEAARRGEDTTEYKERIGTRTADEARRESAAKERLGVATGLFDKEQDIRGKQIMANAQIRSSQIMAAARESAGGNNSALKAIEDADKAYKVDAQRIFAKMEQPLYLNTRDPVRLQELKDMETQLETIRKNAYARYGVPYIAPAAPGDNKEIKRPPGLTEALMQYLRPTK